jgi:hypothetical protein
MRSVDFFPKDAPECFFELWSSAFDMLAQGVVDQCLVTGRTTRSLSLFQKVIHQILIKANGNACFPTLFRFRNYDTAPLTFAEIVFSFHRFSSYCLISCGSAGRRRNDADARFTIGVDDDQHSPSYAHSKSIQSAVRQDRTRHP